MARPAALLAALGSLGVVTFMLEGCGSNRSRGKGYDPDDFDDGDGEDGKGNAAEDRFDPREADINVKGSHFDLCRTRDHKGRPLKLRPFDRGDNYDYDTKGKACDIGHDKWARLRCDQVHGYLVKNMRTMCYEDNLQVGCCCHAESIREKPHKFSKKVSLVVASYCGGPSGRDPYKDLQEELNKKKREKEELEKRKREEEEKRANEERERRYNRDNDRDNDRDNNRDSDEGYDNNEGRVSGDDTRTYYPVTRPDGTKVYGPGVTAKRDTASASFSQLRERAARSAEAAAQEDFGAAAAEQAVPEGNAEIHRHRQSAQVHADGRIQNRQHL